MSIFWAICNLPPVPVVFTHMEELQRNGYSLGGKLTMVGLVMFVVWLATMTVWIINDERQGRQESIASEVAGQWSRAQTIAGPVLTVPLEVTRVTSEGERVQEERTLVISPETLAYATDISVSTLSKGIYDVPVYTTALDISGSFTLADTDEMATNNTKIRWDKAVLSVPISDARGINGEVQLDWNGEVVALKPGSDFKVLGSEGIRSGVVLGNTTQTYPFSLTMELKGSRELSFIPLGKTTKVSAQSAWTAPNFQGEFLPATREVGEQGFVATWDISSYAKNLPQAWLLESETVTTESLQAKRFGVGLHQEVNFYTLVDRAVKYSILFISLTFLTFFMYEVLSGLRIHPMQYLLVGFGVALFYLLLLSFSEVVGFTTAYLVATTACTLLITLYCFSVLGAKLKALSIGILLIALYSYLYILLQLETLSLIFGSVLLFAVLSAVMFSTRNLDWYSLGNR